ncbi:hypothetical protein [Flavobacterium branchiophilum]|uniref:hypothetical protein n=1 Tax=Flavobacterium branchiophilum TaxID=55197 RepID=UPI00031442DE|nr:hypothetical protein [Flavobacterium branchiophilum]
MEKHTPVAVPFDLANLTLNENINDILAAVNLSKKDTINADNIVEEINKQVKHYDKEVMYKFRIESKYAFVEVLINDIPVYKNKPDEPRHHPNKKTSKL